MSNFTKVMEIILKHEGKFSNHPADRGGATNYGIIQSRLEEYRGHKVSVDDVKNMTITEAMDIYKKYYWDVMNLDLIQSFQICLVLMDQGVNCGTSTAIRRAQSVLNTQFNHKLSIDGKLGPITAKVLNTGSKYDFCREYIQMSEHYYADICIRNPSQMVFLKGWLNRAHKLQDLTLTNNIQITNTIPETPKAIEEKIIQVISPYEWAKQELGVKEYAGVKHNPRIIFYHSFTTLNATTDETAWCSAFMCAAFESVGLLSTQNAAARSWLSYGDESTGEQGDIVVFWRGSLSGWQGHVGFVNKSYEIGDEYIEVLGGNQSNSVSIQNYETSQLLGFRRYSRS